MVGGQALDIAAENAEAALSLDEIVELQQGKTGALFRWSASCGAVLSEHDAIPFVEYANAFGNAGSVAGGLWHMRHDNVLTKQWHIAHAVRTGREAALHAHAGATGPEGILEGPQGLFAAMVEEPDELASSGEGWLIETVSFKPFAACRHAHPAIDAAMELRKAGKLQAPFTVETFADALTFCDRPDPKTELEAKFSLQHCVAICLLRGEPSLEDFELAAINEREVAALRARVQVSVGDEYQERYPARFGGEVSAGRELIRVEDALGDPENPVTDLQLQEKALMLLTAGGASSADSRSLIEVTLDEETGARALIETITRVFS